MLVDAEKDKRPLLEGLPDNLRNMVVPATMPEAVDILGRYLDAGFGGFIFRNATTRTPEGVARTGELIKLMRSEGATT